MPNSCKYKHFYNNLDRDNVYANCKVPEKHSAYRHIKKFIDDYDLSDKKCLEIGAATGLFQDLVNDYVGLDITESLSNYFHKPYCIINADGTYPFPDNSFDAIWSYEVHEHIPDLDQALLELKRVLKTDGVVFFAPAWQCRPWAAEGYNVRSYSDLDLKGKAIKLSIILRDHFLWRAIFIIPKRLFHHFLYLFGARYRNIPHKKLKPNYDRYLASDSDACNSIEAHDAILWFESNGFKCISHPTHFRALTLRHGLLIFRKIC